MIRDQLIYPREETDAQNYYYFLDGFNADELQRIEAGVALLPLTEATVAGGGVVETRRSNIKWIPQSEDWSWLYEKLSVYAWRANEALWHFDLESLPEQVQYTEYLASDKGKYDWHQDIGPALMSLRKVSITVQLSAADDYVGGELEFFKGGQLFDANYFRAPRQAGCVVVFPSYMLHRITPVTSGVRKSFVIWSGGAHYK